MFLVRGMVGKGWSNVKADYNETWEECRLVIAENSAKAIEMFAKTIMGEHNDESIEINGIRITQEWR